MKGENTQQQAINDTPVRKVAVLAVPQVHTSALFGGFDILKTAGLGFDARSRETFGRPLIKTHITAATPEVTGWHGVEVRRQKTFAELGDVDGIYIPAIGDTFETLEAPDPETLAWISEQYAKGATIAAACSGVFLPATAGLMDGGAATAHWAFSREFESRFPKIRLEPNRALVFSGDEHRIITSGGGSLWNDLVLYLIAKLVGQEAAVQSSKLYLVDWGRDSQLPYACLEERSQHSDAAIRIAQTWISEHFQEADVLAQARSESGLPQRTFERRFKSATSISPNRYIQQLRIEQAKALFEQTEKSLEDVAEAVGYIDPTSFRRLFSRLVGTSPSQYRKRFGQKW